MARRRAGLIYENQLDPNLPQGWWYPLQVEYPQPGGAEAMSRQRPAHAGNPDRVQHRHRRLRRGLPGRPVRNPPCAAARGLELRRAAAAAHRGPLPGPRGADHPDLVRHPRGPRAPGPHAAADRLQQGAAAADSSALRAAPHAPARGAAAGAAAEPRVAGAADLRPERALEFGAEGAAGPATQPRGRRRSTRATASGFPAARSSERRTT